MKNKKYNILVVDDEEETLELINTTLELEGGYNVYVAESGKKALEMLKRHKPDLLISDIILPDITGYEICKKLRNEKNQLPVIFLSGKKVKEEDRVVGFISGCDDYLLKPFNPRELVYRVKAILQRVYPDKQKNDALHIDTNISKIYFEDKLIKGLSPTEFDVFALLYENSPTVVSKEKILKTVWKRVDEGSSRSLEVLIQRLRKKLSPRIAKKIETITTKGYRYCD